MKFQRGKTGQESNKPFEEETLQRWRAAALKGKGEIEAPTQPNVVERDIEDLSEAVRPITQSSHIPGDVRAMIAGTLEKRDHASASGEKNLERRFGSAIKAALGPGTTIEGKLSFESPVRIDGTLKGEITSTSTLIVGEGGVIEAGVKVGSLIVLGQVVGNVEAQELIEIQSTGSLEGDISTKRLTIEEGGYFSGRSIMRE
ncbi:MAG: polymer-forming cytoskeletal protein [Deltaproteobacteria bacterium]|nr:polymer-forming cytoskeletal protein [Deltaproteobacteria bacterium]